MVIDKKLLPVIEVYLVIDVDEEEQNLPIFAWEVVSITESGVKVSLTFENPEFVSTNTAEGDILVIIINDKRVLVDEESVTVQQ